MVIPHIVCRRGRTVRLCVAFTKQTVQSSVELTLEIYAINPRDAMNKIQLNRKDFIDYDFFIFFLKFVIELLFAWNLSFDLMK